MRYAALDFETGNASTISACAIGISFFEDQTFLERRVFLIKPPADAGAFHWGNIRIHHIKEKMVQDAPDFATVWAEIHTLVAGSVIVCHNASFDIKVLCDCLAYYHLPVPTCRYLCTVKVSQRVWPELENHRLNTVSEALGIELDHHEAGSDAHAAGLILLAALRALSVQDADALACQIGMKLGTIAPTGITPCSIAKEKKSPHTVKKG